jgi:hypothetical protein
MVRVLLSNPEHVTKMLQDKEIFIGFVTARPEPFNKYKSRPKSHFKQCKNCFRLNHFKSECLKKKKVCKYCGFSSHPSGKCRYKNDLSKHCCVLCKKQHSSDSVHCEVIRNVKERLGIKLTRKEQSILKKKIPLKSGNGNKQWQISQKQGQPKANQPSKNNPSRNNPVNSTDKNLSLNQFVFKDSGGSIDQNKNKKNQRKKPRKPRNNKSSESNNSDYKQKMDPSKNEIESLKRELNEMRAAIKQLNSLFQNIQPILMKMNIGTGKKSRNEINLDEVADDDNK